MRRGAKVLARLILTLVLVSLVSFAAYDAIVFQPRVPDIRRLLAAAAADEQSPPDSILKVLRTSYPDHLSAHVARLLQRELAAERTERGMTRWHMEAILWAGLVNLHLIESEQVTLFLALSPMGDKVRGFSRASMGVVGVPLGAVSVDQAARLVTLCKAPSVYLKDPDRLARQAEALARRANNAH